ncbi:MAG: hypothetical protein ABFR82_17155, partial [Nitrospirota bacterium]
FISNLEKDSESWAKSQMIRSYIKEVKKMVAQRLDRHTFQEQYEEWLALAKQYLSIFSFIPQPVSGLFPTFSVVEL